MEKSATRTAAGLPLAIKSSLVFEESLKKKKPRRDALFKNKSVCCAIAKAKIAAGEITASYERKKLWEILKIGKRIERCYKRGGNLTKNNVITGYPW